MIDSQDPCFVFGFRLDGKGGGTPPDSDQTGPIWLHVDYSVATAEQWLQSIGLEEAVVDALTRTETRPRAARFETGDLLLLRGINTNPGADPEDMVSLRIWVEEERIISVRQRRLLAVQDVKTSLQEGRGPESLNAVLIDLLEGLANRVALFVDSLEDRLEGIESRIESQMDASLRAEISSIRRQAASVRRYMAPQREALEAFQRQARSRFDEATAVATREQADRFTRYLEDIDLVRERAMVLQEELLNLLVQQQGDRMYALSIVAAIFLPITFISGVFGMNVAGLPGVEDPVSFVVVAVTMVVVTAAIIGYFHFKRWL